MAVRGATTDAVLEAVGLKSLGVETYPGSRQYPFSIGVLPGGWTVVFSEATEWVTDGRPALLTGFGEVVACRASEIVMVSTAWAVRDGEELWRVSHDPQDDPNALEVTGSPPPGFEEVRDRLFATQAEGDAENHGCDYIFDIPLETAKLACGYRMDEWEPAFVAAEFADPRAARNHDWPDPKRSLLWSLLRGLFGWR